jgi:hypothetical protein
MITTPVQLELFDEITALPGSLQQTSADGADTTAREVSRSAIANTQSPIAAGSDSVQSTADNFFDIVGTEVSGQPADHIRTKTREEVREIIAKIQRRTGSE